MPVKTDKDDARGMAQVMRMGWFRPVHVKAPAVQEVRALLARKLLVAEPWDVESSLRGFGPKVGVISKASSKRTFVSSSLAGPGSSGSSGHCSGQGQPCAPNTL